MEFTILERIILQSLLPNEGDYVTYRLIKELKSELSFSEKEIKDYEISQDGKHITWNQSAEKLKQVEIGDTIKNMIVESLKKLNSEKKINDENVSLYEKFIQI